MGLKRTSNVDPRATQFNMKCIAAQRSRLVGNSDDATMGLSLDELRRRRTHGPMSQPLSGTKLHLLGATLARVVLTTSPKSWSPTLAPSLSKTVPWLT